MSLHSVPQIGNIATHDLTRFSGRIWPVRSDPDFTDSDARGVRVGDHIGTWTVTAITEDMHVKHADNCGRFPLVCASHMWGEDNSGQEFSDCRLVPAGTYSWQLTCFCGYSKETRQPFETRSCRKWQSHSRDIHQFMRDIQRITGVDIEWHPPTIDDLQYSTAALS